MKQKHILTFQGVKDSIARRRLRADRENKNENDNDNENEDENENENENKELNKPSILCELPVDIWANIFQHLPHIEDVWQLACSARFLFAIYIGVKNQCAQPDLWDFCKDITHVDDPDIPRVVQMYLDLKNLTASKTASRWRDSKRAHEDFKKRYHKDNKNWKLSIRSLPFPIEDIECMLHEAVFGLKCQDMGYVEEDITSPYWLHAYIAAKIWKLYSLNGLPYIGGRKKAFLQMFEEERHDYIKSMSFLSSIRGVQYLGFMYGPVLGMLKVLWYERASIWLCVC
ncbi:hypothetical protein F4810DRAFT_643844 [Camillea tinctor]|nr:hypothetical protein F4810DRAFT_643844 [Camillea tinctor]